MAVASYSMNDKPFKNRNASIIDVFDFVYFNFAEEKRGEVKRQKCSRTECVVSNVF